MDRSLLHQPIADLPVSSSFRDECLRLGFHTLKEITDAGWHNLLQRKDFSYLWLDELVQVLQQDELLHLLGKP